MSISLERDNSFNKNKIQQNCRKITLKKPKQKAYADISRALANSAFVYWKREKALFREPFESTDT